MPEIPPPNEGPILVGSGKPPEQIPTPLPVTEKPVPVDSAPTPQQVATEVVKASTTQQMRELLRDYLKLGKDLYAKVGKALGGVAVHEGVKTLQGARELKLKYAAKPDEVLFKEVIHTDAKGRVISQEKTDYRQGTVESVTSKVDDILDEKGKRVGRVVTREGTSGHVIDAQVESSEKKKGFVGKLQEAHAAGNKYNVSQEAKSKQAEGAINAIGAYVTDAVLQPYPDVPRPVTALADAASSFLPGKGIEFIPAVLQIVKADLDTVKSGVELTKRFREIIRKSPEAQGSKGDIHTAFRVARTLITEKIAQMKTPKAAAAAAVFA